MAKGFTPSRHITGDNSFTTRRFQKITGGNDSALLYVGDACYIDANGQVSRLTSAQVTAGAGVIGVGVVAGIYTDSAGTPRVHGLPDQSPRISLSAQADWVDVYIDPNIVFVGTISTSAGLTNMGQNCTVSAGARVTAAGQSGMELAVLTSAISSEAPFKIVGIGPFDLSTPNQGSSSGQVEVVFNNNWLKVVAGI